MIDGLRARGLEVCQAYPGGETPVMLPESLPLLRQTPLRGGFKFAMIYYEYVGF